MLVVYISRTEHVANGVPCLIRECRPVRDLRRWRRKSVVSIGGMGGGLAACGRRSALVVCKELSLGGCCLLRVW